MSAVFSRRPWGRNECVTNEPQRTSAGRLIYLIDFAWFLSEANFGRGAFEDFSVIEKKIKKSATNHPHHLFGVDEDRKFVSIQQLFRYFSTTFSLLFNRFLNTPVGLKSVDNWHHYTNSLLAAVLRLRRGLTIANKSSESNRIRNIESSNSKLFDCIRTIPQIRRKPKHELNGERIQRILELLKFFCV